MASGINFNPASRQISGGVQNRPQQSQEIATPNPTDGFQPGSFEAQPMAAGNPGSVAFHVTKEQLTSTAFQSTLATLASQGVQVNISLVNAAEAQPNVAGAEVNRAEFTQLQNQVHNLENRVSQIAQSVQPKPAPPTYGGD